jgi:hypothetical protein
MLKITPIVRYEIAVAGLFATPPVAIGWNVVVAIGISWPRFNCRLVPSFPRNCGLASTRVLSSDSSRWIIADGAVM